MTSSSKLKKMQAPKAFYFTLHKKKLLYKVPDRQNLLPYITPIPYIKYRWCRSLLTSSRVCHSIVTDDKDLGAGVWTLSSDVTS
jgi:hypothetical protein